MKTIWRKDSVAYKVYQTSFNWVNYNMLIIVLKCEKDKKYRVERAKMLLTLLYGMKRSLYIYEGEKLGIILNSKNSILNYYNSLIKIRKSNPVFIHGKDKLILEYGDEIFAYTRTFKNEKLLFTYNLTGNIIKFVCEEKFKFKYREFLISNYDVDVYEPLDNIELKPYECRIHKLVLY